MTKKTTYVVALLFAFTLVLTIAITASADISDCYNPCCEYHFTVNGIDCWTGGEIVNGHCQAAQPTILCYVDGRIVILDNPCYTDRILCAQ